MESRRAAKLRKCGAVGLVVLMASVGRPCFFSSLSSSLGKQPAFNADLEWDLQLWQQEGRTIEKIFRYKTSFTKSENGIPDTGNIVHHEGVVLQLSGSLFLRMDFQSTGLVTEKGDVFPKIENQIPWDDDCPKCLEAKILPTAGDPRDLLDLYPEFQNRTYDLLNWNCQDFAALVWENFVGLRAKRRATIRIRNSTIKERAQLRSSLKHWAREGGLFTKIWLYNTSMVGHHQALVMNLSFGSSPSNRHHPPIFLRMDLGIGGMVVKNRKQPWEAKDFSSKVKEADIPAAAGDPEAVLDNLQKLEQLEESENLDEKVGLSNFSDFVLSRFRTMSTLFAELVWEEFVGWPASARVTFRELAKLRSSLNRWAREGGLFTKISLYNTGMATHDQALVLRLSFGSSLFNRHRPPVFLRMDLGDEGLKVRIRNHTWEPQDFSSKVKEADIPAAAGDPEAVLALLSGSEQFGEEMVGRFVPTQDSFLAFLIDISFFADRVWEEFVGSPAIERRAIRVKADFDLLLLLCLILHVLLQSLAR